MSRLVVVGTGRCGTRYASHILRAAGVECGHEQVFTFRVALGIRDVRWEGFDADASWLAVPRLADLHLNAVMVVRHPLRVVHSMLELGWFADDRRKDVAKVIYQYRPEIAHERTRADKALAMWTLWNLGALPYVRHWVRLEDIGPAGPGIAPLLAAARAPGPADPEELTRIRGDAKRSNLKTAAKVAHPAPGWDDFRPALARAARQTAAMFGYDPDEVP